MSPVYGHRHCLVKVRVNERVLVRHSQSCFVGCDLLSVHAQKCHICLPHRLDSCVAPGEDAKVKIYFTPTHSGLRKLLVDFDSNRLCHIKGFRNVIIGK